MKHKTAVRIVSIILALLIVGSVFAVVVPLITNAAETPVKGGSGYISDDYVNLRSGAGTNYSVLTCMRKNTKITFTDGKLYNSDWYKITEHTTSKSGYVHKDYVKADSSSDNKDGSGDKNDSLTTGLTGYINADYVNLRSGAGTDYSIITCMRKNTKFTLLSAAPKNDWYNIKLSDGKTGWVLKDYVTLDSPGDNAGGGNGGDNGGGSAAASKGYVNDDYVNLRKGAGTGYIIITCMRKNTTFTLVSEKTTNNWYNIKLSDGTVGWVIKNYVTLDKDTGTSGNSDLKLSNTSETIYIGNKLAITAKGADSVKWTSSNASVADVNSSGVVTAKSSGSAKITASSGNKSASCNVTVKSGSSVNISSTSISNMRRGKSVLLKSGTSGVSWKSSNTAIATVKNGVVDTKSNGWVTISAYTSSGAATCLIQVIGRDNIRFVYATPNSAPKNSSVTFKAITDKDRVGVYFVVTNGSTTYTVNADKKESDGNTYIWSGSQKLSAAGKWTYKAYAKYVDSNQYLTTPTNGEGEVFVTNSTDKTTTVTGERRASDEVINLISSYEGFLPNITDDYITSDPTVGYGKVITTNEQFYNNLTKNEAYAYLCQTVNSGGYTTRTNAFLTSNNVKFNQQQFDALVCFAYNVGAYAIYNDSSLQNVLLNTSSGAGAVKAGSSGYVNASYVNLRSGAGTNYSVIKTMDINTKFTFVDGKLYNSSWYKIKLSDGTVGYIYSDYASSSDGGGGTRDLNNVNKQQFISQFLAYHHAAGSCYWGLLYRRIDEAEMFFYGDYIRDGEKNKKGFSYTCGSNPGFGI